MKSLNLVLLADHWIEPYLAQFSSTVQKILKVKGKAAERQYLLDRLEQNVPFFFVLHIAHQLIGALEIREPTHRSQLYCWLNERWWGRGYFQHAIAQAAKQYFLQTDALCITACIDRDNMRSYYALKKVGFIQTRFRHNQYEMVLSRDYFV